MKPRDSWATRVGFLTATAGSAIGLGSLWKFPYVTGENGGGLFVLAYIIFTFIIGVPIFMAELVIGRNAQKGPVGAFSELSDSPRNWRILGWSCFLANFLVLSYYSVVAGWALNYTLMSLMDYTNGKDIQEISQVFDTLYISGDINLLWNLIFMGLTTGIVIKGISKGIEFWSKILTPALLLLLILLFFYSTTLEGFPKAFSFIFYPDFNNFKISGLLTALGLACFTLSVGMGIILTYGSYMRKNDDIPKTAITIGIVDVAVSLLASLMIFPIIFTFGFTPSEGPGLLFKTMPVVFSQLPGNLILSTTFFLLVVFAALTSTISIMEVLVTTLLESFHWTRQKSALIAGTSVFIFGIPSALSGSNGIFHNWKSMYGKNFFDTVDYFSFTWLLPINGVCIAIFAGWILDKAMRKEEFAQGCTMQGIFKPWLFLVRWIAPIGVLLIMLHEAGIIDMRTLW